MDLIGAFALHGLLLLALPLPCGLRWGSAGLIAPGNDDRGAHVCGWISPHEGHQCFLCAAVDSELTFCPKISDRSLEVEPRRRL